MKKYTIQEFDPDLAHKVAKFYLPIIQGYHRAKFIGLENIPDQAFLAVGNHTGMHFMPESFLWLSKYHSEPRQVPMLTLVHHMSHMLGRLAHMPVHELGFLEARRDNALMALNAGFAVTVYPGGDRDVARPFCERNKINFFDHTGYVRTALKAGVPILPIVGCGGGETLAVLNSGEKFAEWTGLKQFAQIHTWPLYWSFPFGLHVGHFPHLELPLPSQITLSILEPYHITEFGPEDSENLEVLQKINADLLQLMQNELDKLSHGRVPILGKLF